jgi:hypothetical protein
MNPALEAACVLSEPLPVLALALTGLLLARLATAPPADTAPVSTLASVRILRIAALAWPSPAVGCVFDCCYRSGAIQHLSLMMVAPPLMLLGAPWLPLLCGLPRKFVRDAFGLLSSGRR